MSGETARQQTENIVASRIPEGREWLAPFVFVGTVVRRFAATFPVVPVSEATAVVKVVEVFKAPPAVGDLTGQQVTVELADPDDTPVGKPRLFRADGWLYGESLAVVEVKAVPTVDPDEVRGRIQEAEQAKADADLAARLARADVVVVATVLETIPARERRAGVSEHDPDWWEALIAVQSAEKGQAPGDRLSVVFPNSYDELWFESPKLETGTEAILLLQREQREKGWPAWTIPGWTALNRLDVLPTGQLERVRALIARR
jgi:hypothetical protein